METTVETEKVLDLSTGKMIDKPVEGPKTEEPIEDKPKDENKPVDETKPLDKPADKPVDKPADKPIEFSALLKEKYGVDEAGLSAQLEQVKQYNQAQQRIQQLEEEAKKPKTPEFANDQQKKIYEFLNAYPSVSHGEGVKKYYELIDMDVPKIADKDALRMQFVLSKPNLQVDKANRLFEGTVWPKYTLNRDNFDSDEAFKEAQELQDIQKEEDAATARQTLLSKQQEFKAKPQEKPTTTPVERKAPEESVRNYTTQVDQFLNGNGKPFESLTFKHPTEEKIQYNIKLSKEEIADVKNLMQEHLKRWDVYDKDGKFPNFDPLELFKTFLIINDPEGYDRKHIEKVTELARVLAAEQIAGTKPDKESKTLGEEGVPSEIDQFRALAQKEKEKRGGR